MNGSLRVKTVKRLNLYERFKRIRVRMKYNDAYINDASPFGKCNRNVLQLRLDNPALSLSSPHVSTFFFRLRSSSQLE